jgi:hypothetical protein
VREGREDVAIAIVLLLRVVGWFEMERWLDAFI